MKVDRSNLPKSYLQKGFSNAFKLYNEKYEAEDFFGAYFLGFSILEDRLNVLWIVAQWYVKDKYLYDENKPNYWDISQFGLQTKVDDLTKWGYFDDDEQLRLKAVIKDRNTKYHSTLWHLENFNKRLCDIIMDCNRLVDKKRKKQKRELGE